LQLVQKYKEPVLIFKSVEEQIMSLEQPFDWQEIFHLFKKPDVRDADLKFPKFNEKKIIEILVDRHDFSSDRLENQFVKIRDFLKTSAQTGLGKFV
jgi:hypothetical protein